MMKKALLFPYTFTLLNLAAVAGLYHFARRTAASEIWSSSHHVHVFPQGAGH